MKIFSNKPLFTISFRRRHILMIILLLIAGGFGYSVYFRMFMTLPQTAINTITELRKSAKDQNIIVFAPHCDDESLGAGGLINRATKEGSRVKVVLVTDCNKHNIGSMRKKESISALSVLGVSSSNVSFLNFPEGQENHSDQEKADLKKNLQKEIDSFQPTLVVAPHPQDTHVDHKLIGTLLKQIVTGNDLNNQTIYYLIHFNFLKYPLPAGLKPDAYLLPPARLISFTDKWYKLSLTSEEEDQKEEAILKYKSQLKRTNPVLYRVLLDFVRRNELFMTNGEI